jgi:hypothetical protein
LEGDVDRAETMLRALQDQMQEVSLARFSIRFAAE